VTVGELWFLVVGVDPSTSSAGWCVLGMRRSVGKWQYLESGQCRGEDVPAEVLDAMPLARAVKVLGVESMFPGPAKNKQVMPPTFWKMGFMAGLISGKLRGAPGFEGAELWLPEPNEWRDDVGIKRGRRDAVAHRVRRFAELATGETMAGPRGGKQDDRAMAVGIAHAAARRVTWDHADP